MENNRVWIKNKSQRHFKLSLTLLWRPVKKIHKAATTYLRILGISERVSFILDQTADVDIASKTSVIQEARVRLFGSVVFSWKKKWFDWWTKLKLKLINLLIKIYIKNTCIAAGQDSWKVDLILTSVGAWGYVLGGPVERIGVWIAAEHYSVIVNGKVLVAQKFQMESFCSKLKFTS